MELKQNVIQGKNRFLKDQVTKPAFAAICFYNGAKSLLTKPINSVGGFVHIPANKTGGDDFFFLNPLWDQRAKSGFGVHIVTNPQIRLKWAFGQDYFQTQFNL